MSATRRLRRAVNSERPFFAMTAGNAVVIITGNPRERERENRKNKNAEKSRTRSNTRTTAAVHAAMDISRTTGRAYAVHDHNERVSRPHTGRRRRRVRFGAPLEWWGPSGGGTRREKKKKKSRSRRRRRRRVRDGTDPLSPQPPDITNASAWRYAPTNRVPLNLSAARANAQRRPRSGVSR